LREGLQVEPCYYVKVVVPAFQCFEKVGILPCIRIDYGSGGQNDLEVSDPIGDEPVLLGEVRKAALKDINEY